MNEPTKTTTRQRTLAFITAFKAALEHNPSPAAKALCEAFGLSTTPWLPSELTDVGVLKASGITVNRSWEWITNDTPETALAKVETARAKVKTDADLAKKPLTREEFTSLEKRLLEITRVSESGLREYVSSLAKQMNDTFNLLTEELTELRKRTNTVITPPTNGTCPSAAIAAEPSAKIVFKPKTQVAVCGIYERDQRHVVDKLMPNTRARVDLTFIDPSRTATPGDFKPSFNLIIVPSRLTEAVRVAKSVAADRLRLCDSDGVSRVADFINHLTF